MHVIVSAKIAYISRASNKGLRATCSRITQALTRRGQQIKSKSVHKLLREANSSVTVLIDILIFLFLV